MNRAAARLARLGDESFGRLLAAIGLLALAVRLLYGLAVATRLTPRGDTLLYHFLADGLAGGKGYSSPGSVLTGHPMPTFSYPPLYPYYLTFFSKLGLGSLDSHRAVSCLLGTTAVVLVGLLGRRIGGGRTGLIAAFLAAIYPQLFMVDGTVIAESLFAPLIVGLLLVAYRFAAAPSVRLAAALGVLVGALALTRTDGLLLFVILVIPLVWRAGRRRLPEIAAAAVALALVMTPWVLRNSLLQHAFVPLTTNSGLTALATNCDATYYGADVGFVHHACAFTSVCNRLDDETRTSRCERQAASRYARRHLGRVPLVLAARAARLWGVYDPGTDVGYGELWSRQRDVAWAGYAMYLVLGLLAVGGAVTMRRARRLLWPLLAMAVQVTVVALTAFGFSRYRLAVEPVIVVLAAVALDALLARRYPLGRVAPETTEPGSVVAGERVDR